MFETWLKTDLQKPIRVEQLSGNLFSGDNEGNLIGVEVLDNGSAATLSGDVNGYVIRADGATIIISGTLSGNKASIVLPTSAYAVVGQESIVIKVGTVTVGACVAYVYRSTTDTIVDPSQIIPSIEELLAQISACETATANANKVANMTVSAEAATGSTPDAVLSETGSPAHKHITFKLVKGDMGDTGAVPNISVGTVTTGAAGTNVSVTRRSGSPDTAPVFDFTIPKGDKGDTGDAFHIVKTYASVSAMNADYSGTDTHVGDYVMIVSTVEDPDNAKVYIKGSSAWSFVVDMSGATGIQGQQAYVWIRYASAEPTQDSDMKTTADKWIGVYSGTASTAPTTYSSYTWYEIKGAKGDTGNTGATGANAYVWIKYSATQPTQDSDMRDTADEWIGIYSGTASSAPTTYTSYTWYKIKGETGSVSNVYGTTIDMSSSDSTKVATAIGNKADKVTGATSGNFAGLDSNGNLTDSGKKASDFVSVYQGTLNYGCFMRVSSDGNLAPAFLGIMQAATSSADGMVGLVPKPSAGDQLKFLRGDATWQTIPVPSTMTGATSSTAGSAGLVPAPSAGDQSKVLTGAGTWSDFVSKKVMKVDSILTIGSEVTINMTMDGITAGHELWRWNFFDAATNGNPISENAPPQSMEWTTSAGGFTITNNGSDTVYCQPVFVLPDEFTATAVVSE